MREGWQRVALGDLFETTNNRLGAHGEEPEVFSVTKHAGFVPAADYFGKRIASAKLDTYKLVEPDEWAYSTIHIDEGSIARNRLGRRGVVSPMYTTMRLRGARLDPYLAELFLRSPEMLATYGDAQQGSINRRRSLPWKSFAGLMVNLPPLEEQRRIVDLIDAVEGAIAAMDTHASCAGVLLDRARDLIPNAPLVKLSEVLTSIESGVSTKPEGGTGARVSQLTLAAIRPGVFRAEERKDVGPAVLPDRARLNEGDLLITRSNTPERVGYVAVARGVQPGTYIPDLVWRLVPNESLASKTYLEQVLSSGRFRAAITSLASGTSQSMRKINKTNFSGLQIPLPTLEDQEAYVAPLAGLAQVIRANEHAVGVLRELRSNLLTALLSGEHEIPESYDELLEVNA